MSGPAFVHTGVPGKPSSVLAFAEWISGAEDAASGCGEDLITIWSTVSEQTWVGASFDAFDALRTKLEYLVGLITSVEEMSGRWEAYAARLGHLEDRLGEARAVCASPSIGLTVDGSIVYAPEYVWVGEKPDFSDAAYDEWYLLETQRITFDKTVEWTVTGWDELRSWIEDNLMTQVPGLQLSLDILVGLPDDESGSAAAYRAQLDEQAQELMLDWSGVAADLLGLVDDSHSSIHFGSSVPTWVGAPLDIAFLALSVAQDDPWGEVVVDGVSTALSWTRFGPGLGIVVGVGMSIAYETLPFTTKDWFDQVIDQADEDNYFWPYPAGPAPSRSPQYPGTDNAEIDPDLIPEIAANPESITVAVPENVADEWWEDE